MQRGKNSKQEALVIGEQGYWVYTVIFTCKSPSLGRWIWVPGILSGRSPGTSPKKFKRKNLANDIS